MKRIRCCFLLFCVNFLGKSNGFTADIAQSFSIHCQYLPAGKCMKAVPPRKIRLEDCGQADINYLYRWRWTPEGQIQNLETGLCLEIMDYEVDVYTNTDMHLGICSHRNKLQKWICEHRYRSALKLYYTNLAHERLHARWKSRTDGNLVTVTQDTRKWRKFKFNDSAGAEMCDFDQRDHCLQTVAKIPTPENTCLVAVATKSVRGYAEVPISGKNALKDFTISMWVKTRFAKDMGNMGVFSYLVKDAIVLGFAHYKWNFSRIDFFDRGIDIQTAKRHVLFAQSYWVHVAIIRSVREATLSYYVNDAQLHSENSVSTKTIPGTGTLRLGNSVFEGAKWFNGFVSQFNIFTWTHDQENIEKLIQSHHCCHDRLPHGNWLSWDHVVNTWTLHGAARADKGVECTSFEKMSDTWIDSEYNRQNCRTPLFVSDAQYIPDHHFSSSSWTSAGRASYGRASKKIPKAWCPETRDENSYLQVDLGYVQKVTAIGTMLKLKGRHAKRIKVHYSENGIHWHSDGQVYEASQRLVPELNIVPLTSAVTTRYLRLYPTGCIPSRCCLTVEIFGCDPEIDQKISEPEDGCTGTDKPYILMYLPVAQHVTRIQLKARKSKKPIRSFYMYYMSWRQWIPYQVKGRTKVFKGNRDTSRPFTHILILPILTRLIKIFPIPYGSSVCSDFTFIGCHVPHDDFCTFMEVRKARNCRKRPMPQCSLGFVGNGRICQDLNECDIKTGAYCDRNSQCRNKHGSFSCDPCKNNFIGDGHICQTSCEAFGITCGVNSFCDLEQCKCHEGYIYNGTHCTEDPDYGKLEELPTMRPDEIAMSCCTVEKRKASAKKYVETVVEDVEKAYEKILAYVRKTALNRSLWLSDESTETDVYFKMESEQVTGSIKARGAFNKISEIKASNEALEEANQINIITASSGNHGLACAHAMKKFGVQGKIFVPDYAAKDKTEAIRKHGGELEIYGDDYVEAEFRAKQSAKEINNAVYFSSYNSTEILHAQATIGLEILEDLPSVDSVFISVGSGGLISSIATYMKAIKPSVKIVGCQALNSCVMFKSYKAGKVLDIPSLPTLADGTAGKFDPDAFTFDLCCEYVDKWILVSEHEISEAMYFMLEKEHKLVEGSAALCVAALKKEKENHKGENIVLLMCGGNVGVDVVKNVLETNNNVRK